MMVNGNVKTEVYVLELDGKYDEIIKRLQKIKMQTKKFDCIDDEIFINYTMAKSYHKKGNKEFANYYLEYNKKIFEDQQVFKDRKLEYYNHLWLYSDVNKDDISKEEYYKNFVEIYRYYNEIDDYNFSNKAMKSILFADNKKEKVIAFLESVIDEYGRDNKMIQDMVANCERLDNHIYIILKNYLYRNENIAV